MLQQQTGKIAIGAFERSFPGEGESQLLQAKKGDANLAVNGVSFSKENCLVVSEVLKTTLDAPTARILDMVEIAFPRTR